MSTHEFTIDSDGTFPNRRVDLPRFEAEIRASAITVALASLDVVAGNCVAVFRDELSSDEVLTLEQLVFSHSGEPLVAERTAVIIQPFAGKDRNIALSGHRKVCALNTPNSPSGTSTPYDIAWPEVRELQGLRIQVKNFTDGDKISAVLVHPDPAIPTLVDFGQSFVKPDGSIALEAESAKTIPAGIILRLVYTSVGNTGDAPIMYIDARTWK